MVTRIDPGIYPHSWLNALACSSGGAGRAWILFLWLCFIPAVWAEGPTYVSAYWAKHSPERLMDILQEPPPEFQSSFLNAVTVKRVIAAGSRSRLEMEGQVVRHHGLQSHKEFNAVAVARWTSFPWDRWLNSGVAIGSGLSYARREPEVEPRGDPETGDSKRLLHYLMLEKAVGVPGTERWSMFSRVHHRSGIFGLFGVDGGSNFVGGGVRYRF